MQKIFNYTLIYLILSNILLFHHFLRFGFPEFSQKLKYHMFQNYSRARILVVWLTSPTLKKLIYNPRYYIL